MTVGLPVSRLINVTVNLTPPLAQFPNFNTALVLTDSEVIDVTSRIREYSGVAGVAADFGANGPENAAAVLWFGQTPAPTTLLIGRWAKTASHGQLIGGAVSAANQVVATWAAINNGSFKIAIDGVGPTEYDGLDFSAVGNLNAVAAVIESAFPGGEATCVWDAEQSRFVITSADDTGVGSTISFMTAPAAGTDISGMVAMLSTSGGAYVADGIAAETAIEAVTIFDNRFSSQFYGLVIPQASDDDHVAVAGYVEAASTTEHFYGVTTQDAGTIVAADTACVAYRLSQIAGLNHTAVQYSSSSAYAIMSALARILTTNWQAQNSTITLMYKQEPGVDAELLTDTQMNALLAKRCNVFVEYNNQTAIIQPGWSSSGQFVDSVVGTDWLKGAVQTSVYNLLYGASTKIPQTDAGMAQIATQIDVIMAEAVNNGLLAPGIWTAAGFGQLVPGQFLSKGYYIYTPPISQQSPTARAARESVPFQVAAKLGGAVHTVDISIDVQS